MIANLKDENLKLRSELNETKNRIKSLQEKILFDDLTFIKINKSF